MPKRHPLVISRRREYFPWDRINWIKEALSNDGKDFIIPLGFAETSLHKNKREIWETM